MENTNILGYLISLEYMKEPISRTNFMTYTGVALAALLLTVSLMMAKRLYITSENGHKRIDSVMYITFAVALFSEILMFGHHIISNICQRFL